MAANHPNAGIPANRFIKSKAATHSYADCVAFLGNKDRREVASHVTIVRLRNKSIAVRLYQTYIITYHADGTFDFTNGGWGTQTTSTRCNQFGPKGYHFANKNRKLYAWNLGGNFVEGTRLKVG